MASAARVLVVGAGIAGSTLVYWLGKHGFSVVVIERSPVERTAGQGIDIEEPALEVVKMMGVLDDIKAKTTKEIGTMVVDEQNRPWAVLDADGQSVSLTRSIEIMRGDLAEVLYKAADSFQNVEFRYKTTIHSLQQTADKVIVELQDKNTTTATTEEFDIVVGADGVNSRTRRLAMGSPEQLGCLKPVGCSVAFFSIPREDQDWPRARFCQFPGRRSITTRPRGENHRETSAYMIFARDDNPSLLEAAKSRDNGKAKQVFAEIFKDAGWEAPRIIEQMLQSDNFYFDRLTQVKLESWSKDRVVLLGDAAHAPSPLTGQGTALALLGAFVLGQEISRSRGDLALAFTKYEQRLRRYVKRAQTIPLYGYAPSVGNPQTSLGIWLFRSLAWFFTWSGLVKLIPDFGSEDFDLEIEAENDEKAKS